MKLLIVLIAVVAAVSAYPGIPWAAPVASHGWQAPAWQPAVVPEPVWQPAPKVAYLKIAQPVAVAHPVAYAKVHGPSYHHVQQIPQQVSIPPPHPSPLKLEVHSHAQRIHYDYPKIPHPHLIGIEQYHEPEIKIVKPVHHSW